MALAVMMTPKTPGLQDPDAGQAVVPRPCSQEPNAQLMPVIDRVMPA
jgi:hypothetical protein